MSVQVAVGSFVKDSTGVNGATQAVSISGSNWVAGTTPKAVVFWTAGGLTAGSFRSDYLTGFGFSDGVTGGSYGIFSDDNAADSLCTFGRSNAAAIMIPATTGGAYLVRGNVTSFAADEVNVEWVKNDTGAYRINYLVLGGDELQAKVLAVDVVPGTGSQAVTGVGFQPEAMLAVGGAFTTTPTVLSGSALLFVGAAAGGSQWVASVAAEGGVATSNTHRRQRTTHVLQRLLDNGTADFSASLTSFDADGATLNVDVNTNTSDQRVHVLFLAGASFLAGSSAKPTATPGPQSQTVSSLGFFPFGVFFAGTGGAVETLQDHAGISIGATDGDTDACSGIADADAQGTTVVRGVDHERVQAHVIDDSGGVSAVAYAATTTLANGEFTLSWNPNDSRASLLHYLAIGEVDVDVKAQISWAEFSVPDVGAGQQPYAQRSNFGGRIPGLAGRGVGTR